MKVSMKSGGTGSTTGTGRTAPSPRRRAAFRAAAIALGAVLLLCGGGLTLLAWAQSSEGGYFTTPPMRFGTPTAALKSDEIAVGEDTAHAADPDPDLGELARVRIVARSADPDVPMFIGIGPKDDVEAYLRGTAHDEFTEAGLAPFDAAFRRVPGGGTPADPRDQAFWVASSAGTGTRTLEWDKSRGPWSVVALRLDGRCGIDTTASVGLRFGLLLPAGLGALGGGALLLAGAGYARRRRA